MRYIIEASLLHARLLNRTLILPSYVYARGCEHELWVRVFHYTNRRAYRLRRMQKDLC